MNCAARGKNCLARLAGFCAFFAVVVGASAPAAAAKLPDVSDPRVAMETWMRLKGDLAGRVTYEWAAGTAYGVPQDEPGVALFSIESVTVRRFRGLGDDKYEEQTFSCRLYKDADSGAFIDEFVNPLTGKNLELKTPCRSGQAVRYSPSGRELLVDVTWESSALGRPIALEMLRAGGDVVIRHRSFSAFTAANGAVRRELAIDTFVLPARSLADAGITNLAANYSWDAVRDWSRLLDMPDTPSNS